MKRFSLATALLGVLFQGCTAMVASPSADPAPIAPVQFLRPTRDGETGTWIAAWVDPENYQTGETESQSDSK